jgi:hypothetical protein
MIRTKAANQNKYMKSSAEKEESLSPPLPISNAFASESPSLQISRPYANIPYEAKSKCYHTTDIEIIEDLDLSDCEDIAFKSSHQSLMDSQSTKEITSHQDQELENILFPTGIKDFSSEWKGKGFSFQLIRDVGYGLIQTKVID